MVASLSGASKSKTRNFSKSSVWTPTINAERKDQPGAPLRLLNETVLVTPSLGDLCTHKAEKLHSGGIDPVALHETRQGLASIVNDPEKQQSFPVSLPLLSELDSMPPSAR